MSEIKKGNGSVKVLTEEEQKFLEVAVRNGDREKYIEILQIRIIEDPGEDLSGVMYSVGKEPENLKSRLDTLLTKIEAAYPFGIVFNMTQDHKKWGDTLTDLYRKLGYPSGRALLRAYGFTVAEKIFFGNNDYETFVVKLKEKYPEGSSFSSVDKLATDCPELNIKWKSWKNNAPQLYGMSLSKHLISEGIISGGVRVKGLRNWDNIEKEFDVFVENMRKKYGEKTPKTYDQFAKDNPEIEDEQVQDYIRLRLCTTPARYFKEQGLIGLKNTPENKAKKHVDFILNSVKSKYTTAFQLPENFDAFISENERLLEDDFQKAFEITYPNETLESIVVEKK